MLLFCASIQAKETTPQTGERATKVEQASCLSAFNKLPLSFERNQGQGESGFLARGQGYRVSLSKGGAELQLSRSQGASATLRIELSRSNPDSKVEPLSELPGKVNYLLGNDPSHWRTSIPTYARVKYAQVYPGIDLVYYGQQRRLEYDFVVQPGADPNAVVLNFQGAENLARDAQGNLIVRIPGGEVIEPAPLVYQEIDGGRKPISGAYKLLSKTAVRFEIGAYDPTQPLIIDPVLCYSTYFGGGDGDYAYAVALDKAGNVYLAGKTYSTNFPGYFGWPIDLGYSASSSDGFVAKFNAAGSVLIYSTYLGGSSDDEIRGIAVDALGNALVAGDTTSLDFPTVNALQAAYHYGTSDAFVAKLGPTGAILTYSTYLGGSGIDQANGIAVDAAGNAYVTGFSASSDFPTVNAFQPSRGGFYGRDAFVAKINPTGTFAYCTYLGGSGFDQGIAIAVDANGEACVTGSTDSYWDFPVAPGGTPLRAFGGVTDAFVAKFNAAGSALIYSTYLGGNSTDMGTGIAVDTAGNAYVTGITMSTNFPAISAVQSSLKGNSDAFVAKINAAGSALVYSTYLGGSSNENATVLVSGLGAIAVDTNGNAYVTGTTASSDFPGVNPVQASSGGGRDAFVAQLNAAGSTLTFSTYLGGSADETGWGIAVDGTGGIYVAGETLSTNFPTVNALLAKPCGGSDAFLSKIVPALPAPPALSSTRWTPLGPAPALGVTRYSFQPTSGRVVGVAAHPTDSKTIYLAAAGGGVWKTIDGGAHWSPLTDSQITTMMGAIALAPSNPNVIYAGTGEGSGIYMPSRGVGEFFFGRGILKSTDAGNTWILQGNAQFDRHVINRIVVHPTDANTVYVAVAPGELNGLTGRAGIWKSADGGTTWTNTTTSISTNDIFSDLAINPSSPQILYAAVGSTLGANANGLYKSINAGASWTRAGNFPAGVALGNIKVAVAASSPQILYASIGVPSVMTNVFTFQGFLFSPGLYKMMKSTDGGSTWNELTSAPKNYLIAQPNFNSTLAVDPANPNIIYAGGTALGWGQASGLLQSTDGGASWRGIEVGLDGVDVHGDAHAMGFDASGRLLFGDDGGIWRLDDAVNIIWANLNTDLSTIQFDGIALHPTDPNIIYGGAQDNGTLKFGGTPQWSQLLAGDGGYVRIDPAHPATVYTEQFGLTLQRSDDNGLTFAQKLTGVYADNSYFYVPYVMDPSNPNRLLYGTDSVYESLNRGENWTRLSLPGNFGWTTNEVIESIAVAPSDPNTIYASPAGTIYATFDHANSWQHRDIGGAPAGWIQGLLVDSASNLTVYAARATYGGGHVFLTSNGGQGWADISGDLPDLPAYCLALDPRTTPHTLYVGNHNGVYVTQNLGAHWSRVGSGLPNTIVLCAEVNTNLNILAAGTYGRGLWEIGLNAASVARPSLSVGLSAGNNVTLSWPASATGFVLQSAPAPSSPGSWSAVTNSPVQSNGRLTVTVRATNTAQFFRLTQP